MKNFKKLFILSLLLTSISSFGQEEVEEEGKSKVWVISLSNPSPIILEAIAESTCEGDENPEACKSEEITRLLDEIEELRIGTSAMEGPSATESPSAMEDSVVKPPQPPLSVQVVVRDN